MTAKLGSKDGKTRPERRRKIPDLPVRFPDATKAGEVKGGATPFIPGGTAMPNSELQSVSQDSQQTVATVSSIFRTSHDTAMDILDNLKA